jgi:hypothetical protein
VHSTGAAQFFDRQRLIARIEQDRIDVLRDRQRFLHRFRPGDVNDLHQLDPGQRIAQFRMHAGVYSIAQLQRIRSRAMLLLDDSLGLLPACQ